MKLSARHLKFGAMTASLLALPGLVGGCGFTPLYAAKGVVPEMSAIQVKRPNGRAGYLLGQSVDDELGRDPAVTPKYRLQMGVNEVRVPQGISVNNEATRYEVDMTVTYTLNDIKTGAQITKGKVSVNATYNSATQPYASLAASLDGKARGRSSRRAHPPRIGHLLRQPAPDPGRLSGRRHRQHFRQPDHRFAGGIPARSGPGRRQRRQWPRPRRDSRSLRHIQRRPRRASLPLILSKRAEIERFLASPGSDVRVALIYGRDRAIVRERADALAAKATERPDDPFDVAMVSEADVDAAPARLFDELAALSMMGGRRLVHLRLEDKPSADKAAAEALKAHLAGELNPDAMFLIEAGALGRDSALRKAAEADKAGMTAVIPCYEDETGDVARLVREGLAKDKVGLNGEALDLLVRRLPHERGVARREIERLALFLGPGSGTVAGPADLEPFLGVEPEASLADAASDAFGGRLAAAQAGLRRAAAEGESAARRPYARWACTWAVCAVSSP